MAILHTKKALIDKANASMVAALAVAGFLVMFAIIAGRALYSQRNYQGRVIAEKEKAVSQLDTNIQEVEKLAVSYKEFVSAPDNIIGGNPNGTGDRDGNNSKIVLDSLPSKYDFPALITSIEKLLNSKNFRLDSIGGKDEEVAQSKSDKDEPVAMPFEMETTVNNYDGVRDLLSTLELSIRPIKVKTVKLAGGTKGIGLSVEAESYYQAAKGLTIKEKVVK